MSTAASEQSKSRSLQCLKSTWLSLDLNNSNCSPALELEDLNSVVRDSPRVDQRRRVMGRGKIEIKRIENPTSRQVTFSKRRGGLIKKGHELAVLCEAEVAVIIFSSSGKLFEFASSGSMRDILERYSRCPDGVQFPGEDQSDTAMGREVVKLRQHLERLQLSRRHMQGEELEELSVPDLVMLEQQLDLGASRVRAKKNQLLLEEIEELRRKEKDFQESNDDLRKKLADAQAIAEAAGRSSGSPGLCQVAGGPQPEAYGGSSQQAVTLSGFRDPQTSQTSLHLGLFPEASFMPSSSRRTSQQSPTEAQDPTLKPKRLEVTMNDITSSS